MENMFLEEAEYLDMVKEQLEAALDKYDKSAAGYEEDYNKARRYLTGCWNEMDPMERFSNERSISCIEATGNHTLASYNRVKKLRESPYFAHIDFQFDGDTNAEEIYIGLFGFTDDHGRTFIYDWRAPISGMYYEYQTGPATYEAPAGRIQGEIVRKRQLKIEKGNLVYVLENTMNIDDDILRKELSSTSDEKMKNIIATIQKEQNRIIRNVNDEILIIQGVAGSGKTSIALHRIAFLLYRQKERLRAQNVAIISPNKVFADYISNVLPELGEEPISELSFEEIAKMILGNKIFFEKYAVHAEDRSQEWMKKLEYKSSADFVRQTDDYLIDAEKRYFIPCDCTIGCTAVPADFIQKLYNSYRSYPIMRRFPKMADDILEMLKRRDIFSETKMPPKGEIVRKLRSMLKMDGTLELYRDFYSRQGTTELFELAAGNTLEWPDVYPYLYMYLAVEGNGEESAIQHLVIDEMQDYTPIQYAVINKLFRCRKTILGDVGQSITPYNSCSPEIFRQIFGKATFVSLTKSYRSTCEIIEFARSIKSDQRIQPVERHGETPEAVCCADPEQELTIIRRKAEAFLKSSYATMGILCKDFRQANLLYEYLSKQYPVHLLNYESTHFENGIHITSIPLSKGLEFDEVLIPFVNAGSYQTEFDRNLLYIACTRAMHKLSLTYCGTVTELLQI